MSFTHLHTHSHYSILEWLAKPIDYIKKAKELWMKSLALTDTSNLYWAYEFYKLAKQEWIKPIIWLEILVESSLEAKINHKLILLAKSKLWYQNLILLITKAHNNFSYTKTINIKFEDLKQYSNDLICLSWWFFSEISFYILSWKTDKEILERINQYIDIFWKENYYLELVYHNDITKQRFVTDKLIEISNKYNIDCVATNTVYYVSTEDKKTQDVIQALWSGHEIENPDRPSLINWDYSFLSEEQMQILFGFIPQALENTKKIADMVDIHIESWNILIPKFKLDEKDEHNYNIYLKSIKLDLFEKLDYTQWYLRYISFYWLNFRFWTNFSDKDIFLLISKLNKVWLEKELTKSSIQELKDLSKSYYSDEKIKFLANLSDEKKNQIDRLEYELLVINKMWFEWYFLIVLDYIRWAKNNNIPVWPWRWSVAWSLMAYLSWITDIDPLKYALLFERFLNPSRISMPDIDVDFADEDREKVIDYCRQRYWNDCVAPICTFGTFAARAAIKDVGRVFWIPFSQMNKLASFISEKPWTKLKSSLESSIEFKEAYENWFYFDETKQKKIFYKDIIDNALKIEWNVRQIWVHACAVIISPEAITNYTALQFPPKDKNILVTQYSAYPLEDLWLLKMDFLWLKTLTLIKNTIEIIKISKNIDLNILNIDLNDEKTLKLFQEARTFWVFQFESDGMKKYLKDLKANSFEDLIAMVSLYRPGPMAYLSKYISRKHWLEEINYMTDELINILKSAWYSDEIIEEEKNKLELDLNPILWLTYWIAIYQEQLLFIVQYMAWFSIWEADLLRRWIWKKKIEIIEQLKFEFIKRWAEYKWYKEETTKYIYEEMIQPAANYSFNKSHAACYAFISFQTGFLKANYTCEFMSSLMSSEEDNLDKISNAIIDLESLWINVLSPDINESLKHFTYIDDKNIRFWLKAIKWLWDGAINKIIESRKEAWWKFSSLNEFIVLCAKDVINKKSLESLIKAGALDKLGERWKLYHSINDMIKYSKKDDNKKTTSQISLFDMFDNLEEEFTISDDIADMSFEDKLNFEKEVLWLCISWHLLDGLWTYCIRRSNNINKLKMTFDELSLLAEYKNPNKDKRRNQNDFVQVVWIITDIKKIMTKTSKFIFFIKWVSYNYNFELSIFQDWNEQLLSKLELDKFIIASWFLNINFEFRRKGIQVRNFNILSISQARKEAIDLQMFDNNKKKVINIDN